MAAAYPRSLEFIERENLATRERNASDGLIFWGSPMAFAGKYFSALGSDR
jgi:hypothetical protein